MKRTRREKAPADSGFLLLRASEPRRGGICVCVCVCVCVCSFYHEGNTRALK